MSKLKGKIFELVMLILWIIYFFLGIILKDFFMFPFILLMIAYYTHNIYIHVQEQREK